MPDALINPNPFLFTLFILYGCCFLVQMVFYWAIFLRVGTSGRADKRTSGQAKMSTGVSVVICAHNEYQHLEKNLPLFLEQDYPLYEVVVVDHASDDDTSFLLSDLAEKYKHLKVVSIRKDLNFFTGKKFPLSIGIKSAKHEIILLTDADCRPAGTQWIRLMQDAFTEDKEIILGYGAYEKQKGILNALIRFDTIQVAIQYLSFALAGIPYMGVGRNLAYRKRLFYQEKGFISHYRINSGDDDLFINRVARKKNTGVQRSEGSFTYSDPKTSIGNWFTQKRRHMTTGMHYRFLHKFLLGLYSATQLLFWVVFGLLMAWKFAWIVVLSVLLFKWVSQYIVFGRCMIRLKEKQLIAWIPLLEWITLILQIVITGTNLIVKPRKWK